jgi:hypothetical protein
MSERVSDDALRAWMSMGGRAFHLPSAARELLEARAKLAAWEALGESPEAVRKERETEREELSRLRIIVNDFIVQRTRPMPPLGDSLVCPTTNVAPPEIGGLQPNPRPTPLEALERAAKDELPNVAITGPMLAKLIHRARRAAGEVL